MAVCAVLLSASSSLRMELKDRARASVVSQISRLMALIEASLITSVKLSASFCTELLLPLHHLRNLLNSPSEGSVSGSIWVSAGVSSCACVSSGSSPVSPSLLFASLMLAIGFAPSSTKSTLVTCRFFSFVANTSSSFPEILYMKKAPFQAPVSPFSGSNPGSSCCSSSTGTLSAVPSMENIE